MMFWKAKKRQGKILKQRHNDYAGIMAELIVLNNAKTIVEIGVNKGDTTLALCEAAKEAGGHVYGFDMWDVHGLYNQFKKSGGYEETIGRLKKAGLDNFTLLQKNTFDDDFPLYLKEKVGGRIDLAFIDGDHSYKGCLNDFKAVYPLLSETGVVIFHDTQRIDGCREFMLDLRTKYFDGTYDVFDLFGGYKARNMGISFLVKRQFPVLKIPINQLCGSPSSALEIEKNELNWYKSELDAHKNNEKVLDADLNKISLSPIENFRPTREYLS